MRRMLAGEHVVKIHTAQALAHTLRAAVADALVFGCVDTGRWILTVR